jgi:membrane-associated protease RseP (regulator of RpoE activity)
VEPISAEPAPALPDGLGPLPWPTRRKFQDRRLLHLTLLLLTIASTTFVGRVHYELFLADFVTPVSIISNARLWIGGAWYSLTILAILGCHELGHYFACRYYDVDASLPYFLPFPLALTGTLGAFIRIREPFPSKQALFDIGIAGPIAGFLVAVPALFVGVSMSHVVRLPEQSDGMIIFGEPLLYKAAEVLIWGTPPNGYGVNLHPMGFAAWFGLLATALNLFPIAQLDGGHISYAVLGRRSSVVTVVMIAVALTLAYFSSSWIVWAGLMVVMLYFFGPHHPRTPDEYQPLDRTRMALAAFAVVMFVLCFTPVPIQVLNALRP